MRELIFLIEQSDDGGFTAQAVGESIFTEANSFDELKFNIIEAVEAISNRKNFRSRFAFDLGEFELYR